MLWKCWCWASWRTSQTLKKSSLNENSLLKVRHGLASAPPFSSPVKVRLRFSRKDLPGDGLLQGRWPLPKTKERYLLQRIQSQVLCRPSVPGVEGNTRSGLRLSRPQTREHSHISQRLYQAGWLRPCSEARKRGEGLFKRRNQVLLEYP